MVKHPPAETVSPESDQVYFEHDAEKEYVPAGSVNVAVPLVPHAGFTE
jgi:hypothetical protein